MAKLYFKRTMAFAPRSEIDEKDFFLPAYERAAAQFEAIVSSLRDFYPEGTLTDSALKGPNNILAFDGERGQGKTTAMLTFINLLENKESHASSPKDSDTKGVFEGCANILKYGYSILEPIDPSSFEEHHTALSVVTAQMYKRFIEKVESDSNKKQAEEYISRILKEFQTVHESLALARDTAEATRVLGQYEGSLEQISRASDSTNLAMHFSKLVYLYLKYVEGEQKDFLVIPIDDVDLSLDHAYRLAEEFRKFLAVPNVIVITALKIEQLKSCVEANFSRKMKDWDADKKQAECAQMAEKYIDKFIPVSHRITLPNISTQSAYGNDSTELIFDNGDASESNVYATGIQKGFLKLIWERTGLGFVKSENEPHPIVPLTMRETVQFLTLLYYDMKKLEAPESIYFQPTADDVGKIEAPNAQTEIENQLSNLDLFATYFLTNWIQNALEAEQIKLVQRVWMADVQHKHEVLCTELLRYIENSRRNTVLPRSRDELSPLVHLATQVAKGSGHSLGSAKTMLNAAGYIFPDSANAKLLFALRTIYSITMVNILLRERLIEGGAGSSALETRNGLYLFVGDEFWGNQIRLNSSLARRRPVEEYNYSYQLMMQQDSMVSGNRSRFEIDLPGALRDEWNDNSHQIIGNSRNISASVMDENHVATLVRYAMLGRAVAVDGDDDQQLQIISSNYKVATRFWVDVETIFLNAIYPYSIQQRVSVPDILNEIPQDIAEQYLENINTGLVAFTIANVEVGDFVAAHLVKTRNIHKAMGDNTRAYIEYFLERYSDAFSTGSDTTNRLFYLLDSPLANIMGTRAPLLMTDDLLEELVTAHAIADSYRHGIPEQSEKSTSDDEATEKTPLHEVIPNTRAGGMMQIRESWKTKWKACEEASIALYSSSAQRSIRQILLDGRSLLEDSKSKLVQGEEKDQLKSYLAELRLLTEIEE